MTQEQIYTNFMIEYDKAQITSSYPSLTKTEIATILNKAYLALIAQKFTGNNPRKASFEYDGKAIEDLRPLEKRATLLESSLDEFALNELVYTLPNDYLYYIQCIITVGEKLKAIDGNDDQDRPTKTLTTQLVTHEMAKAFYSTDTNMPWIKNPVTYIEGSTVRILVDPYRFKDSEFSKVSLIYIKKPTLFTKDFTGAFELTDQVAEELVSLAIVFATETVESPRLQTKSSILPLES